MKSCCCFAVLCALWSAGLCVFHTNSGREERSPDFDVGLESWSSLKRRAGYYTASGLYRGGLYKKARDEELVFYDCNANNRQFCIDWTVRKRGAKESERGDCKCKEKTMHYCASWFCIQKEILQEKSCGFHNCDSDRSRTHRTTCSCSIASVNGEYCKQWTCIGIASHYPGTGSDNTSTDEIYTCAEPHKGGRYCERWTGTMSSGKEVESSVCECDRTGRNYCSHWICKERSLKMCETGGPGWCDFRLAVGFAGAFGLVAILGALAYSVFVPGAKPACRLAMFAVSVAFLCLPWTAAVAIWGGVRGLMWVGLMWGTTFLSSVFYLYSRRYD